MLLLFFFPQHENLNFDCSVAQVYKLCFKTFTIDGENIILTCQITDENLLHTHVNGESVNT